MESELLERIRLLWEGDATADIRPLWRHFTEKTPDLTALVERIAAAGRTDPALECEDDTLAAMRDIADRE